MPFDEQITNFAPVAVPTAKPFDFGAATPDERLLELARKLDAQDEWRGTILEWHFERVCHRTDEGCGTAGCAMGLAKLLWPQAKRRSGEFAHEEFGLEDDEACALFVYIDDQLGKKMNEVTPGEVATAIRQFVFNRKGA